MSGEGGLTEKRGERPAIVVQPFIAVVLESAEVQWVVVLAAVRLAGAAGLTVAAVAVGEVLWILLASSTSSFEEMATALTSPSWVIARTS